MGGRMEGRKDGRAGGRVREGKEGSYKSLLVFNTGCPQLLQAQ